MGLNIWSPVEDAIWGGHITPCLFLFKDKTFKPFLKPYLLVRLSWQAWATWCAPLRTISPLIQVCISLCFLPACPYEGGSHHKVPSPQKMLPCYDELISPKTRGQNKKQNYLHQKKNDDENMSFNCIGWKHTCYRGEIRWQAF